LQQREVGAELTLELPEADYEPEAEIRMPRRKGSDVQTVTPQVENGQYVVNTGKTNVSGVWEVELRPRDGNVERRLFAVNVPPVEGDLHHLDRDGLDQKLPGIEYEFSLASQLTPDGTSFAGFQLGDTLLYLLLVTLVIEQWFAYQASYHTRPSQSP
jgi:hypothetical protein